MPQRLDGWTSKARTFLNRVRGQATSAPTGFEGLEPRQLLSAELPIGGSWIDWDGTQLAVKTGSYIVTYDDYVGGQQAELLAREVATRLGVTPTAAGSIGRGGFGWFEGVGEVSPEAVRAVVADMPMVRWVEPDRLYEPSRIPNDPRFTEQYSLRNVGQLIPANFGVPGRAGADINVVGAWDVTIGSREVVIGIIDSGINYRHPDLAANMWINPGEIAGNGVDDDGNGYVDDIYGFDFGDFDADPDDPVVGHGTQVASVVGAVGNNGIGVTGVAWNVSLMALKIADRFGRLTGRAIIAAHDYATMMRERGVNLVATNNSYGGIAGDYYTNQDQRPDLVAEEAAIRRFLDTGGIFIAAAGNSSLDNDSNFAAYPASFALPGIISVAATDNNDALAGFSNFGVQTVDVAAPGVQILMASNDGGYQYNDGTSFASPIVAGVVALIKTIKPNASAVEIREALINGSDQLPSLQDRVRSGGRINVGRTLDIIGVSGPVVRSVDPGPISGQVNPSTGQPYTNVTVSFSKDIDPASLSAAGVTLRGSGPDDIFGNGNDVIIPISAVAVSPSDPRRVVISLNLSAFSGGRLPVDTYRLTLVAATFRDLDGRLLNGNNVTGRDEVYDFTITTISGNFEPNDTLAQATPVVFNSSGEANFVGVTLGNGLAGNLDVDLYRIDMPRGGLITVETIAQRLSVPSTLDTVLRLFNAQGQQIAINDQYFGSDSLIDFFVRTGGTYYIGVSGFGNPSYDPTRVASGSSQSLGTYNLKLGVKLVEDNVVTYQATDPNLPRRIPVDPAQTQGITTSFITVTDARQILDVNVRMDITHTYTGDLRISLIAPNNREVLLFNRRGGSGDNLQNTLFDDEAGASIANAFAPFNGNFRPEESLGNFDGLSGAGVWTLRIADLAGLNAGTLNSWSLQFTFQNDIFGPFESNDTLVTASNLAGVNGSGSAQITAFIGDGGFGDFDRDFFRFVADSGSTLTAIVTPTASGGGASLLNTAMRLFDDQGNQLLVVNPANTNISRLENFVFANAGVYYLAVSESNNVEYNPFVVGDSTSNPSLTTGGYTLTITLAAGVSDAQVVLAGNNLDVGVSPSGLFGAGAGQNATALAFNGIEFLPGQRRFLGATVGGTSFTNGTGPTGAPFSLTNMSDSYNQRVVTEATFRGLRMERSFSYGIDDNFIAVDLVLTNTTQSVLTGVFWAEGFNPDPGVSLGENSQATFNDITSGGKLATARYVNNQFGQGITVALGVPQAETRAKLNVLTPSTNVRDAQTLHGQGVNDPNGSSGDGQLALSYDFGNVAAGATVSVRYFIFFGLTPADVTTAYTQLNDGTGQGHLTVNRASPASETLQTGTETPVEVPTVPYRVYYPEGFYGDNIFTFLPISNPNKQEAKVYVIARYEQGTRDQLVGELTIPGLARSGLTLVTPELFQNGTALAGRVNPGGGVPAYALEIRSDLPVSAMFSHYDLNLAGGATAAIGEAFTTRVSTQWSFGTVSKGSGASDFLTFYNPNDQVEKVIINFFPVGGGAPIVYEFNSVTLEGEVLDGLDAYRRGGVSINDIPSLAPGDYGVTVQSQIPIVAALSRFDSAARTADGQVGNVGLGATRAVIPEGQFGLNADAEVIGVLNPGQQQAEITFSFIFANGSAYRTLLVVDARSHGTLDVSTLPNFPRNQPYGLTYESTQPVSLSSSSSAFNDGFSTATADRGFTVWGFGEGFRPGDVDTFHPGVVEYLRLYNPSTSSTVVEITISYDGVSGSESFRRTLPAARISQFNIDDFITGTRRTNSSWFSITVKAPSPIVAYMGHYDRSFPGGFGTLGTPLGQSSPIT
ncbi:MAG: S8 family serine peptidase [Phycisphaeraceae bacterium]|nr:S8 family serine peptidase [Phycisphaeraceae bacterium]